MDYVEIDAAGRQMMIAATELRKTVRHDQLSQRRYRAGSPL